jgi:hypothetical protein
LKYGFRHGEKISADVILGTKYEKGKEGKNVDIKRKKEGSLRRN